MTAAYRFRGLGWFVTGVIVVLGFYLVSLQVAAERKKVDDVNRDIARAERDIRSLETEFNTRANLAQLERWNGDVLALAAPTPTQFLPDEVRLAQLDFRGPAIDTGVRTANYLVPSLPVNADQPAGEMNGPGAPRSISPSPVAVDGVRLASTQAPSIEQLSTPAAAQRPATVTAVAAKTLIKPVRTGPSVALLDRKLLNDSTLGDLLSRAQISTESTH